MPHGKPARLLAACAACAALFLPTGCVTVAPNAECLAPDVPRELQKTSLPPYVIEVPDVLQIDALRVVPLPPYRVEPLDTLYVTTNRAPLPQVSISGVYTVDPDGTITLPEFGQVRVIDLDTNGAAKAVLARLEERVRKTDPELKEQLAVYVSLTQSRGVQQIRGQHLVRPDGTIGLGTYGSVYVQGLTLMEAKSAIEQHLSAYLYRPEVAVDVYSYNSKWYYVITDGGGFGEQVYRIPATGNETVLDAISSVNGLPAVASKNRIWLARPAPANHQGQQILPVDWKGITMGARTATNYQVLPGDRVYVMAQPIITTDTALARVISPIERLFGVVLLGSSTVSSVQNLGNNAGNAVLIPANP